MLSSAVQKPPWKRLGASHATLSIRCARRSGCTSRCDPYPIPRASTPAPPTPHARAHPTPYAAHPTPAPPLACPIIAHHSARALPQADAEKQRLLLEQAEANDAKYELISLRAEHHAVKREHHSATGAIATLQAQLDEANEALRSLKNNYRQARDELAALRL